MKYAHSIKLNVFSYENENSDKILDALIKFIPCSLEKNKIIVHKSTAKGFNEAKIRIFGIVIAKTSLINQFLDFILKELDKMQKETIMQQAESRLDENLDFFIRFDKENWMKNNQLELTDSGKCFHLKIRIAAFPKKREFALKIIKNLFSK